MDFPKFVSFTVTHACNLRCKMCGQWSEEGIMRRKTGSRRAEIGLKDWKRLVDEIASRGIASVLIRGGEPFLFPGIVELLEAIHSKGIFISIDTNGTLLKNFADDLVRIGKIHVTISLDGPKSIHDDVRDLRGSFDLIQEGIGILNDIEKSTRRPISKSICFTISPYSVMGLGDMPAVARSLFINTIVIVPYYYFPQIIGNAHEAEMKAQFNCNAFSWRGFHHEGSGIDFIAFRNEYKKYLANLNGIVNYPYMKFTERDYRNWFGDSTSTVGSPVCTNVERLIDIQPGGDANFCVDFPDFIIGNIERSGIGELWNGERAESFREYRRKKQLPICLRCGAKYMAES
jgi:MoaA/NifB/PqqE/SkfB family radical SAM enzyme